MSDYLPRRRRPGGGVSFLRPALFAAAFLGAGAVAGYLVAASRPEAPPGGPRPGAEAGEAGRDRAAAVPAEPATGARTRLVFRTLYPACDGETARSEEAGTARAGLTRGELERRLPGWRVESFRPGQVILVRSEEGPCPDEALYRTVMLRDGRVVVYGGRPGRLGPLLQETEIAADRLLPADREKLSRGVEVRGDAGVWQLLEGLDAERWP